VVSSGGIILAAHMHQWTEGGRGGALATIFAIFIVLLRPDRGLKLYEDRMMNIDPQLSPIEKVKYELAAVMAAMRNNSQGQTRLNKGLVIASGISTLAWGFGDIAAKWLMDIHLF